MATYSAIKAIQNFYGTLPSAPYPGGVQPTLYFAEAPVTKLATAGIQLRTPFVVLIDGGEMPSEASGRGNPWAQGNAMAIFDGTFILEFYYNDLGDADTANYATLWGGQNPLQEAGLAFCTLSLDPPYYSLPLNCIPMRCTRGYAGFNIGNQRVHRTRQEFTRRIYQDGKLGP